MKRLLLVCTLLLFAMVAFAAGSSEETMTSGGSVQLTAPGTFPIVEEMVTMTYMMPSSQNVSDYEDNYLTQLLEEKTNVHMDLRITPSQDYNDKMNLMFASGSELPDMIFPNGMDVNAQLVWGEQGVLIPLNDLIEDQAVYLREAIAKEPAIYNLITSADGNIYSVPRRNICYHCDPATRYWINQLWLDALGLEVPTTTEEFRQVLEAFKTQDPNGNGEQDEIALIGARTGWQAQPHMFLLNSFVNWRESTGMYLDNGEIVVAFTQPEYQEGLRYLNGLVQDGLLDPVSFTQDMNQLSQLLVADPQIVGVYPNGGAPHYNREEYSDDYISLAPLRGPEGVQFAEYNPWFGIGTGMGAITSDAAYPEVAIRWFDQFFDFETSIIARFGRPGTDWRYSRDDEEVYNSGRQQSPVVLLNEVWGVQQPHSIHWYLKHPFYLPVDVETADWENVDTIAAMGTSTTQLWEYVPPADTQFPPISLLPDDVEEYNETRTAIRTYMEESRVRFIVGNLSIEDDWDDYLETLDAMGLERFVELNQAAYDRVWK